MCTRQVQCTIQQESFQKSKKGNKSPGTKSMARVPKKVCFENNCNLCKKHGVMYTLHTKKDCCKYEKGGLKKANFHAAKKGGKKPNPAKQSFTQFSKKLENLEKAIKKQVAKRKKHCRDDSDSDSE